MKLSEIPLLGGHTLIILSCLVTTNVYALNSYEISSETETLVSSDLATVCDQDVAEDVQIEAQTEESVEFDLYGLASKPKETVPITIAPLPPDVATCMRENCSHYDRKDQPYNGGINPALPKEKDPQRRDCRDFASDVLQCAYRECSDSLQRAQCKVRSLGRWVWKCSLKKKRWELEGHNQLLVTCGNKSWIVEPQADPGSERFIYDDIQGSIGIYPPNHLPEPPGAQCPPPPGKPVPRRAPWPPHYFFPQNTLPQ